MIIPYEVLIRQASFQKAQHKQYLTTVMSVYTECMKRIIPTVFHRNGLHLYLSLALGGVMLVLTLLQLFSYEDMPSVLSVLLPNDWISNASIVMACIVTIEVFAIPYFLPLALSPLARLCSAVFALFVPLVWAMVNAYAVAVGQDGNAGFTSPKLPLHASFVSVSAKIVLFCAVVGLMIVDQRRSS